jgi:NADH-ubiquinone oxidoreductase chain 6
MNLFILNEIITNGMNHYVLNIISLISISFGILVIVSKNPIVSVLFLIGLFISIAGYLMMLGINFIGLSYLLVYVGAVSILFIFILMLINVRISELVTENNNSVPLAIIIIGLVSTSEFYIYNSNLTSMTTGPSGINNLQHVSMNENVLKMNNISDNLFTAISSN